VASTPTVEELLVRLTRLEQEVAAGKAAAGKERAWSNRDKGGLGRREVLKMAGMAAAASAGRRSSRARGRPRRTAAM